MSGNGTSQDSSSKRILFVDDDEELLSTFSDLLSAKGYDVSTATDGEKGLEKLKNDSFDIVLCDLMMPNMTGDQLYLEVEKVQPEQCKKFVFITGYDREPKFADFLAKTQQTVLRKPVTSSQLTQAIEGIG